MTIFVEKQFLYHAALLVILIKKESNGYAG